MSEFISTKRLRLRKITPDVLDHVFNKSSKSEQMRFLGVSTEEQRSEEEQKYRKGHTTHNKSFLYFQLLLGGSNQVIGWCGYHTWYLDHDRAEIGYGLFDDEFKGQGYMSETIEAVVGYGFDTMQLHRIEAFISPSNQPSLKLVKRLKFVQEGYLKEHYKSNGAYEDSLVFALFNNV